MSNGTRFLHGDERGGAETCRHPGRGYVRQGVRRRGGWCLRASLAGFRHVVAADLFVVHHHCGSFLPEEKARLSRANGDVILKKYPFYADIVKAHRESGNGIKWKEHVGDPLFERLAEEWNGKGRPAKRALLVGLGMAKSDASEDLLSQARHLTDAGYLVDVAYMRPGSLLRDFAALGCRTRAVDPDKAADAGAYEDVRRVHYDIVICSTMRLYKVATELRLSKDVMWFLREIANPEQVAEHVEKLERLKKRLSRAEQEIADLKASFAYRTGMALTWPLRKVYGLARKR